MTDDDRHVSRRTFLKGTTTLTLGAISARGIYEVLDTIAAITTPRVSAAPVPRKREQYLVEGLETIDDNGVTLVVPPRFTDVITATLASTRTWNPTTLSQAQKRLEKALRLVEEPHAPTAAGLTIVVGWGLPFFHQFLPAALWQTYLPVDLELSRQTGTRQYAVLDAIRFPSDPADVVLEENHVMFKLRSDSQELLQAAEQALFEDSRDPAYVGDLFDITSKRMGFLGRGFDTPSVAKDLALAAGVPGADQIPDNAQLLLGFTSTQQAALGPDNIVSFETLPGLTNQWPGGYFAGGCALHLSHLFEDLQLWYNSCDYSKRVARMFSPRTAVPENPRTVTLGNGPGERSGIEHLKQDAMGGVLGHNATLQVATRLPEEVTDNYGRVRLAGTPVPLREDFNTLDNPFAWSAHPEVDRWSEAANAPGMHFVVFIPTSHRFHTARLAMDGILPDGSNLREAPYNITDDKNGINQMMRATHRQNYLIPPRQRRSFPLVELVEAPSTSFIKNPGFELDANGDGAPDNWSVNRRARRSNRVTRSGEYALRHAGTDGASYIISQVVPKLTAGVTYTVGGWVNIPRANDGFRYSLVVRWRNSRNRGIRMETIKSYGGPTGGWEEALASLVAPAGTASAVVMLVVRNLQTTFYVDDIVFRV